MKKAFGIIILMAVISMSVLSSCGKKHSPEPKGKRNCSHHQNEDSTSGSESTESTT